MIFKVGDPVATNSTDRVTLASYKCVRGGGLERHTTHTCREDKGETVDALPHGEKVNLYIFAESEMSRLMFTVTQRLVR